MCALQLAGPRPRVATGVLLLAGTLAAFCAAAPAAATGAQHGRPGAVVRHDAEGLLYAVAATSSGNVWAVGQTSPPGDDDEPDWNALIMHWNGTSWKRVPSPSPGTGATLSGVAAVSARSAWAVGWTDSTKFSPARTVIVRWNGAAWKRVPTPHPRYAFLNSVAATSGGSAWAVSTPIQPPAVIVGWNGASWQPAPIPDGAADDNGVSGVAATSARNAWAVGGVPGILHWNGTAWKLMHSPGPAADLAAVAATSARNAWAVGSTDSGKTLIDRWNGAAWKRVPGPTPAHGGQLTAVAATSTRSAWAVGWTGTYKVQTVILRWNGAAWKRVPSPSPGTESVLQGVTATSASNAWAVGWTFANYNQATPGRVLILHWNGRTWKRVPSP